jgi:uncharacterized membrane protein YhaH (DUF805 family)
MRPRASTPEGFCLLEVVVATTTLIVALSALAQLLTVAALATRRARAMTLATVLAQQKIEDLVPQASLVGAALPASSPDTLARNVDGYCDFVDASGRIVGLGTPTPVAAVYVRRWSIETLSTGAGVMLALHVLVTDAHVAARAASAPLTLQPADAHIVSVVRSVP